MKTAPGACVPSIADKIRKMSRKAHFPGEQDEAFVISFFE
jgi:hypothetical protein